MFTLMNENQKEKDTEISLLNKLNSLQKKILYFLNVRLKINLTGNEIKIDLNNKNICDIDLGLLSCIEFKNLEEINLSHNKISKIDSLNELNSPKLKIIDLSFNNIKSNNKKEPYKKFAFIEKVILDNSATKDIKEIKDSIITNNYGNNNKNRQSSFFITTSNESNLDNKNEEKVEEDLQNKLINKLDNLEKKVINFLNIELEVNITGEEIKIDLNKKNITNIELKLLSCITFKNLQEINLSNNKIDNIEILKDFNCPKLKSINLSNNKIQNIESLKEFAKIIIK